MSSFVPSTNPAASDDIIPNDGFFPDIELDAVRKRTGLSDIFSNDRIVAATQDAIMETNAVLADWVDAQEASKLADVPAKAYGEISEKTHWYLTAVCYRVRSMMVDTTRDYDSTKSGHDRADALEATSDRWLQSSNEAVARLMGRKRTTVELI
ncbi:MAG: head completion/stabilization protein [Thalassospira sp.]|jgi:hypothetical protein|uniref:head completion/stabilization protein n=1 Tax=Thalassospira sp. 11-3 TaxID=2135614 RepID=UPI000D7624E7|nr:head completion/stabilization protein [Thalassospira sp. 11-3]MBL4839916.1 head completion/stabilization protein [Thalassospira sp.]PXX30858.1 head completion protein GPL [Thalassospira sp. 11-3]